MAALQQVGAAAPGQITPSGSDNARWQAGVIEGQTAEQSREYADAGTADQAPLCGRHVGPVGDLAPGQRAQQQMLHARGYCTVHRATLLTLQALGWFEPADLRALPPCEDEQAWWRQVRAEALV